MPNEHIGRLQQIGVGIETTPGTPVAATHWIPKVSSEFVPVNENAVDDSAYGVIDEVFDTQTTKSMTDINANGILRDDFIGVILRATMGIATKTVSCTLSAIVGGTPAIGDSVSVVAPAMTGTIKYIANGRYYIQVLTGTFLAASNGATLTDGVWTATIGGIENGVYTHVFERLNTNNHPALTIYGYDPVDSQRASYCLVDTFEFEMAVGQFVTFTTSLKGRKIESPVVTTPVYTSDNPFIAKFGTVKFATDTSGLDVATAVDLSRIKFSVNKNVIDYQAVGDVDVRSLHNQQFTVEGDLDALYDSVTFRDFSINSTKRAVRVRIVNTDVTIGITQNPEMMVDIARVGFQDWGRSNDNNGLVTQTMAFNGEFSVGDAFTIIMLLTNTNSVGY